MDNNNPSNSSNGNKNNSIATKANNTKKDKIATAIVRYVIHRPITIWRRFSSRRKKKRISKKIDEDLKKDDQLCCEILILGGQASGKTTICKQMKILYGKEYSDAEKQKFIKIIDRNIKNVLLTIVKNVLKMENLISELQEIVLFIENYNFKNDKRREFYICAEILWSNLQLHSALEKIQDSQLQATTQHFGSKIAVLKRKDFVPTDEDILHCYEPSKAVVEVKFKSAGDYYKMSEIPNLMYNKQLWKQVIKGKFVIIFVVPINTFLELEGKETNPFTDALQEFQAYGKMPCFFGRSCVIFLNKVDLFTENIFKSSVNLEHCFPGFSENEDVSEDCVVTKAKNFVSSAFAKVAKENKMYWTYIHFTCGVDSEDVNDVYKQCQIEIKCSYLCSLNKFDY
ncbi:hypothetical protein FQR65_LT08768 [Abscondita terminalis]|nr:hypothetical protein FQR65_LT08768 [Abscondita terminalis]